VYSEHWVGYTFPQTNVTGVRAQWREPIAVTGSVDSVEYIWIGLGGWSFASYNIAQIGTFVWFPPSGGEDEEIWYEFLPAQVREQSPGIPVNPGDLIFASVVQLKLGTWQISLTDVSNPYDSYTTVMRFNSDHAYPDFVVEDPNAVSPSPYGPFAAFPHWGSVLFTHMQVRIGNTWVPAASLYGYQIQMVRNGHVLATAGPISADSSFTARQG
jgi:hypothetical protein